MLLRSERPDAATACGRLPAELREVLATAAIAELSRSEIGARIGKSEEAVQQLLARARARLARELSPGGRSNGLGSDSRAAGCPDRA